MCKTNNIHWKNNYSNISSNITKVQNPLILFFNTSQKKNRFKFKTRPKCDAHNPISKSLTQMKLYIKLTFMNVFYCEKTYPSSALRYKNCFVQSGGRLTTI